MTEALFLEFVGASGDIIATLIAALAALLIGRRFDNQAQLKKHLANALNDIEFLMEVEKEHCSWNKTHHDKSYRVLARQNVRKATGLIWVGDHTPSKARRLVRDLDLPRG